ncbi:MAG: DUF2157 domain-containing protein [Rhizobiaceae bacterium]|nr:DUF2157 domain-containing protein [Rhizobiaceae bacterium]
MAGYLDKLGKDITRWRASGLVDAATATALEADARAHHRAGFSFGSVLMILAATLFGAALLLAIAANWEAIPRLVRVGGIFAVLIVGYAGGAFAKGRGHHAIAEGLWLVAAVAFGGGIALIGQMYHLSGDEADALFVWALGTAFAAAGLRSGPLTAGAVLLAGSWMAFVFGDGGPGRDIPVGYLVFAVALWAISLWTASVAARHLILLSLMLFVVLLYIEDELLYVPMLLAALSVAIVVFTSQRPVLADRVSGLGDGLAVQGLLGFIAGMSIVQAELYEGPYFLPVAIVVFAGIVGALLLAGRDNRALRWLAYAGFIFELGFVYLTLLDTMLGTAGFFFMAGLLLALLAWLISRIEKRLAAPEAGEGA